MGVRRRLKSFVAGVVLWLGQFLLRIGGVRLARALLWKMPGNWSATRSVLSGRERTLGETLAGQSRHAEAEAHFRTAILISPGDAKSHRRLAASLVARQEWEQALDVLRMAQERFPSDGHFSARAGAVLLELGRIEEAVRTLEVVAADEDAEPRWLRWYAHALAADGQEQNAFEALDRLLEAQPEDVDALRSAAAISAGFGRDAAAVAHLERLCALAPSAEHLIRLSRLLLALDRPHDALGAAYRAIESARGGDADPEAESLGAAAAAKALLVLGQHGEAVELLTAAAAKTPSIIERRIELAEAYDELKDYPAAERAIEEYLADHPDAGPRELRLAAGYFAGVGNIPRALAIAQDLAEKSPMAQASILVADYLQRSKRFEEAAAVLRDAIEADPFNAPAMATLATMLDKQNLFADAADTLERALSQRPHEVKWRRKLASIKLRTGELFEAERLLRHVLATNPDDLSAREKLARSLLLQGRLEEAERHVNHAAVEPRSVYIAFCNYWDAGRPDLAFRYLEDRHAAVLESVGEAAKP